MQKSGAEFTIKIIIIAYCICELSTSISAERCRFRPLNRGVPRYVKIAEDAPLQSEIFRFEVWPRTSLILEPVGSAEDKNLVALKSISTKWALLVLNRPLKVLSTQNRTSARYRLTCYGSNNTEPDILSLVLDIDDVNDNAPEFVPPAPYHVVIEESVATGTVVLEGIRARDRDRAGTLNSKVQYFLQDEAPKLANVVARRVDGGNSSKTGGGTMRFGLTTQADGSASLVLKSALDYDKGERDITLHIVAKDQGIPSLSSTALVVVHVEDVDDLPPAFSRSVYRARFREHFPIQKKKNHQRVTVDPPISAVDQDTGINAPVQYSIVAGDPAGYFAIDADLGTLYVEKYVDREVLDKDTFTLTIQATQVDNPAKWTTAALEIEVMDLNDNLPIFEEKVYNISIMENLPKGFSVLQVVARDLDKAENSEFTYRLHDPSHSFVLEPATGWLIVSNQTLLDREKSPVLKMKVSAVEKQPSILAAPTSSTLDGHSAAIEVYLLDTNDNNPSFVPHNVYHFQIEESALAGAIVGQVRAEDADEGPNGAVVYYLQLQDGQGRILNDTVIPFSIHPSTGHIIVADSPLDRDGYTLLVEASDQPTNLNEKRTSLAIVNVKVEPSVDTVPQFVNTPYEFWVGANAPVDTSVGQVKARGLLDSQLRYRLKQPMAEKVPVAIDSRSGVLKIVEHLHATTLSQYWLEVEALDDKRTLSTNVTLHVVDMASRLRSEVAPINFSVKENVGPTLLGTLTYPMDRRLSRRGMEFSISTQANPLGIHFQILPNGSFFNKIPFDREEADLLPVTVIVQEKSSQRPVDVFHVFVHVLDVNDNPPKFLHSNYSGTLNRSNAISGALVQLQEESREGIKAVDADAPPYNVVTYTLSGTGSQYFAINSDSGQISLRNSLSASTEDEFYTLLVTATDQGNLSSQVPLTIRVIKDTNRHPPRFTRFVPSNLTSTDLTSIPLEHSPLYLTVTLPKVPAHALLGQFEAFDEDEGEAKLRFHILEGNFFEIGPHNGILTLKTEWPDDLSSLEAKVGVSDSGGLEATPQVLVFHCRTVAVETTTVLSTEVPENEKVLEEQRDKSIKALDDELQKVNIDLKVDSNDFRLHNSTPTSSSTSNNQHSPRFRQEKYELNIPEGSYDGREVLAVITATDPDLGPAGTLSYSLKLLTAGENIFGIAQSTGQLRAHGVLDRESVSKFELMVTAEDQGHPKRNSSVTLIIHLVDVNDNRPQLSGYDAMTSKWPTSAEIPSNFSSDETGTYPVYIIRLISDAIPAWTRIVQVLATDKDTDNNGELNYRLLSHRQEFAIEERTGEVYNTVDLRDVSDDEFELAVQVSDQGTPSLSSFAVLKVFIERLDKTTSEDSTLEATTTQEIEEIKEEESSQDWLPARIFAEPLYEMSLEENCLVPRLLWNLSQLVHTPKRENHLKFELIFPDSSTNNVNLDENGLLWLTQSPDRENVTEFHFRVKAVVSPNKANDSSQDSGTNRHKRQEIIAGETMLKISILDENDNAPQFLSPSPLVAAVPVDAPYGYGVIRLQAHDADEGLNAALRYDMVAPPGLREKLALQPFTGQIKVVGNLAREGVSRFVLNVTVRDKEGAADGLSAMTAIIVNVVDESRQVALVLGVKPTEVEDALDWIMQVVRNVTAADVRVRGIEAHTEGDMADSGATDLYLYAVNHSTHALVEPQVLLNLLETKKDALNQQLREYGPRHLRGGPIEKRIASSARIQVFEVTLIAIGAAVFVGALVTIISVLTARRKKKNTKGEIKSRQRHRIPATLIPGHLDYRPHHVGNKTLYVSEPYGPGSTGESTSDTYVEVPLQGPRDISQDNSRQYYIAANGLWTVVPRCRVCQAHTGSSTPRRYPYCECSLKRSSRSRSHRRRNSNEGSDAGSEGSTGRSLWGFSSHVKGRRMPSKSPSASPVRGTLKQLPSLAAIRINYHPSLDKHASITSGESFEDSLKPIRNPPPRQSILSPNTYSNTPAQGSNDDGSAVSKPKLTFFGDRT